MIKFLDPPEDVKPKRLEEWEKCERIMKLIERDKEEEREHNESWSSVERNFK